MKIEQVELSAIRLDGGTQARIEMDQEVVMQYAEKLKDGDKFPPVVLFKEGKNQWLADGFHRYHAHQINGLLKIESEVRDGTLEDAILYAYGANGTHGLSLTAEDKRRIVKCMLEHPKWGAWSNAEIARHVGVSKNTVSRVRASLQEDKPKETKKIYKDKHGKETVMETKNIGKKAPAAPPPPDTNPVQDDQIKELTDTIAQLHAENEMLKDKIAIGQWDATEIEKIDIQETVSQLREQVRVLEIDNRALRDSRDMYQARNAELMKTVKSLQSKLKKLEDK